MASRLLSLLPGWRGLVALAALAAAVGLAVAVGTSILSVSDTRIAGGYHGSGASAARTGGRASPSPSSGVAAMGRAGAAPRLYAAGLGHLLVQGPGGVFASGDGGTTWTQLPPGPGSSLAAEGGDGHLLLAGGTAVLVSSDAGRSWRKPAAAPPAPGPYTALAVNPGDPGVWFLSGQDRLLRTRDGGVSWRQGLGGLPPTLSDPLVRPALARDAFLLASGNHVYLLRDNGQSVDDLGSLPAPGPIADLGDLGGSYVARAKDGHLYLGTGRAWTALTAPLSGPLAATSGHLLVADGGAELGQRGDIEVSLDGGATWQKARGVPTDQSVEAVAYTGDGKGVAYTYGGDVLSSEDGGLTWSPAGSGLRSR